MFGRKPYGRDIDRVEKEISSKEKQFRRWDWQQQATFLRHYSQTAMPLIAQIYDEPLTEVLSAQGYDPDERYAADMMAAEIAGLLDYFSRLPEGAEKISDPNITRSMALTATVSYTGQVGLPSLDAMWAVYEGVLTKRKLLPLAR